jgi:hypothetical protein
MGFAERQMRGLGESATDYVTMMGPGNTSAPAPTAPAAMPPMQMMPNMAPGGDRSAMVAMGVGIALVVGLGFVIYKATR